MAFATVNSLTTNRSCIKGSPPLIVNPPFMFLSPWRYFPSCAFALSTVTGTPFVILQVSGLWQYKQRNWQPVVQATTRIPGPSTADPVVNECKNPMSPVASAVRTSDSGTPLPRSTRSSYGLLATSGVAAAVSCSGILRRSVEGSGDHVHLLLAGQTHEVDRVARDANRQVRILLGMVHRVEEHLAIQHVHVHVVPGRAKERVHDPREVGDAIRRNP